VWIIKNWVVDPPNIQFEQDIYKNLNKSRYYESFGFANKMRDEKIKNGDYIVRFSYDYSKVFECVYGTYELYKVRKNGYSFYEFIDTEKVILILFTSNYYLNQVIQAEEHILSWCKELNIIE
jgi:hypothetical protein